MCFTTSHALHVARQTCSAGQNLKHHRSVDSVASDDSGNVFMTLRRALWFCGLCLGVLGLDKRVHVDKRDKIFRKAFTWFGDMLPDALHAMIALEHACTVVPSGSRPGTAYAFERQQELQSICIRKAARAAAHFNAQDPSLLEQQHAHLRMSRKSRSLHTA